MRKLQLLTEASAKIDKSVAFGYRTAVLHLLPADLSGRDVCPWRTPSCTDLCLNTSGHGGIPGEGFDERGMPVNGVQRARLARTQLLFSDRPLFMQQLAHQIALFADRTIRAGYAPAVRLNGTSDLTWERLQPTLFERFDYVQFYDYTKSIKRAQEWAAGRLPGNYHLTFSRSERTSSVGEVRMQGIGVAVVYSAAAHKLATESWGAVDGDAHDLRFLDPRGALVALKAKGRAIHDTTGFVVR